MSEETVRFPVEGKLPTPLQLLLCTVHDCSASGGDVRFHSSGCLPRVVEEEQAWSRLADKDPVCLAKLQARRWFTAWRLTALNASIEDARTRRADVKLRSVGGDCERYDTRRRR